MKKLTLQSCSFPNQKKWLGRLLHSIKFLFIIFLLIPAISIAQPIVAPVNPPTGGFNIDGTLRANTAAGDWTAGTGLGGYVLQSNAGIWGPVDASKTTFTRDGYGTLPDHIFDGGKFGDNPNTKWTWKSANCLAKCDIGTGLIHTTTSSNSKWVILGGDRFAQSGTSYIDFQFSQGNFTKLANGTFSSLSATNGSLLSTGGRTVGDFVLSMEYTNGGALATVHYYRWELAGSTYKYIEYPIPGSAINPSAFGRSNTVATEVPYEAFGSTTYQPYAFAEAAVNIDAIIGSNNCQSVTIRSVCVTTKSSDAYTADLKDFVDPQSVSFTFGSAGLNYGATSFCKTGTISPTVPNPPQGTFSSTAGLNFVSTSTGEINLATSTPGTYTVTYTPSGGVCLTPSNVNININPFPTASISGTTAVCKDASSPNVTFTGAAGTAPYTFTYNINGGTNTTVTTTSGNSVTVAAPTGTTGTFIYNLVSVQDASSTTCSQTQTGTATINVHPTPTVTDPSDQSLCNGASTNAVNFSGAVSGSAFSWTNDNTSIGLAASGSGNIISFTAVNSGSTTQIATITVTPSANSCTGSSQSFTITVYPTPTVTDPTDQLICNGASTNTVNFSGAVSSSTFSWTNDNASIGLAASGSGDINSFTAVNTGSTNQIATITVTPSANSCSGSSQSFTITVKPTPTVTDPADQSLCDGASTNAVNFSGAVSGSAFSWTNDNTSIGLAASGSGNISSFTAVNTGSTNQIATITVTPSANSCTGSSQSFTITVYPRPVITISASPVSINTTITTTSQLGIATISPGDISDYNYSWVITSKPSAGSNASLTNPLLATPVLNILSPYTSGNYVVQVTATHKTTGCSNTKSITVPVPVPGDLPCSVDGASLVCPGTTNTYNGPSPIPVGFTYTWTVTGDGTIDGATNGTSVQIIASGSCNKSYTVKLHIESSSGVIFTDCELEVAVDDNTVPTITTPASNQTAECDGAGNTDALNAWLNSHGGAAATDNCSGVTWTHNFTSLSDGCGATGSATVIFTAEDACGNKSTTTATFTIEDKTAPSINTPAGGETVECGTGNTDALNAWLNSHGGAAATDNCSNVTWTHNYTSLSDGCGATGSATVIFTAEDACGNKSTTTATFTIEDKTAPTITFCPADVVIECSASILPANTGSATATDNCSTVTPTYNDVSSNVGSCSTRFITRTWTATDECGNSVTCVQRITVRDRTAPVITCNNDGTASATDNCSATVQLYFSNGIWTAIDESGNISTHEVCPVSPGNIQSAPAAEQTNQVITSTQKNAVNKQAKQEPLAKELKVQAYPNPFSSNVKFMITSPVKGRGTLEVYNATGQKIRTVHTDFMVAGIQTVELSFPATQVTNLVYVLRIDDKQVTGKLLQIKH